MQYAYLYGTFITNPIASLIIKVILGIITYLLMLIILRDRYVYEVRDINMARLQNDTKK